MFNHKNFLATLTNSPGVYCMQDKDDTILYIGKARHLKKRMARYFFSQTKNSKTRALVAQIAQIFVTVTHTEGEALILENTLIKTHQPRYNILLRDDKSYPYIFLTTHTFPSLGLHRGAKAASGRYFGPYPHVGAVHETLKLLQKLFPIRQCQDSFYRNRSRPCLQYQIKRCSAPCVGLIDEAAYQEEVQHAVLFLEGKSQSVITTLVEKMEMAAQALAFEKAAKYRDQISHLKKIQAHQYVSTQGGDIDIIAAVCQGKLGCLQVLTVRDGRFIGNKAFFPKIPPNLHLSKEIDKIEQAKEGNKKDKKDKIEQTQIQILLSAFLPQYYLAESRYIPNEIILNCDINEMTLLTEVISQQRGRQIHIHSRVRGVRARWVEMAMENAKISLVQRQPNQYRERLAALSIILLMEKLPQRLECFDISHTQGEATIASCVVFDSDGARRRDYRRFNIENITPGDDYAAMRQVVRRRYHRLQKEKAQLPDIIFIDGGIGQVQIAQTVLNELQLAKIRLIGVAKGVDRNSLETLILPENETPLKLPKDSPALLLIQHIRDEAHRFAITAHRKKLAKKRRTSVLEEIKGIGTKRRQRLLSYFGGLQSLSRAGVPDLTAVPGISRQLAQKIYDFFSRQ
jgi:excinuclease ABC subunit C